MGRLCPMTEDDSGMMINNRLMTSCFDKYGTFGTDGDIDMESDSGVNTDDSASKSDDIPSQNLEIDAGLICSV